MENLTHGSLFAMLTGKDVLEPVVQVLSSLTIGSQKDEHFRLILSDGQYQHSHVVLQKKLKPETPFLDDLPPYTIFKIIRYQVYKVQGHDNQRVLCLIAYQVLKFGDNVGEVLGDPININHILIKAFTPIKLGGDEEALKIRQRRRRIAQLNPENNRYVIRARVMFKSGIKSWSNDNDEGKLFNCILKDESGEIRITGFTHDVDKLYDYIEVGKVYYITDCMIRPANRQYNDIPHDFEMILVERSIVQVCSDDVTTIPQIKYNFIPISEVLKMEVDSFVDVIGFTVSCGQLEEFVARNTGRDLQKLEVTLMDKTKKLIKLTLWDQDAAKFNSRKKAIIVVKSGRISEFKGVKTINIGYNSMLQLNPDLKVAKELLNWCKDCLKANHVYTSNPTVPSKITNATS